jgi:hypothetical protein
MKRAWIGLALLSGSWLFGLSYFENARPAVWAAMLVAGTALLAEIRLPTPARVESAIASLLLFVTTILVPWPYRAAPLLLFAALVLTIAPIPRRWPKTVGGAALVAGAILTIQWLATYAYECVTAGSHELPRPIASLLPALVRLFGIDAALRDGNLAMYSVRTVHELGATWELLLDLPTLCFLAGGIILLCLGKDLNRRRRNLAAFALVVTLWLPARAAILIAVFLHRALLTDYDAPFSLMNQFWSPWVHLAMLAIPVMLACRFIRADAAVPLEAATHPSEKRSSRILGPTTVFAAVFLLCLGLLWEPSGKRKAGRVLVDEHRSTWERTDRPFDVNWYGHESGYNYACLYDYCSRFYRMGRLETDVNDLTLRDCDVLIVKVPTSRYDPQEVDAIERFVERGGGLLLIGEHTNVFNTGTHLNDIARRFGFAFRYDCLFGIDSSFEQLWRPPLVPHPIVQRMPPMDFAVSCSIRPGVRRGRAVIRSTGLWNLPADYHVSNYYPQVEDHAYARYGAFIQLWTTQAGAGRVSAFTDSTIFSNFSTFEPGKAELMLGTLEWLNHDKAAVDWRPSLLALAAAAGAAGLAAMRRQRGACVLALAVGLFGWVGGTTTVRTLHRHDMPSPVAVRPYVHVVMDRTLCETPLSRSGFIDGQPNGFGIFERWILRLGYFTSRRSGPDVTAGDLVVFAYPTRTVTQEFRDRIVDYVASGGRVLVLDSPENAHSTANSLLYPFGLGLDSSRKLAGSAQAIAEKPPIRIDSAYPVSGGRPVVSLDGSPVAATAQHGRGSVTAVGFASLFVDSRMGVTGDVVPDETLRTVFDLEFSLFRQILSAEQTQ